MVLATCSSQPPRVTELEITGTGRELKGCHFPRGVSFLPATTLCQARGLSTEPVNCPLNTASPSIAEKILQFPGGSSICPGMQEAWGKGCFGGSGVTPLLRAAG